MMTSPPSGPPQARCPLCGARHRVARGPLTVCAWCGAGWEGGEPPGTGALRRLLRPGRVLARPTECGGLHLDDYTFRMAATGAGLRFRPAIGDRIEGHRDMPARGALEPLAEGMPRAITLVVLCTRKDPRLGPMLQHHAPSFAETVVVLDEAAGRDVPAALASVPRCKVRARRLDGFDGSRNAAQAAAETPWTFHLDTDERASQGLLASLSGLVALADAAGLSAIGFPRHNVVDGVRSDHFPDVQYRLVRRTVRFEGAVHERPDACRHWPDTMIALSGSIAHTISRAHVLRRRSRYDAMGQSGERAAEVDALLTAYAG